MKTSKPRAAASCAVALLALASASPASAAPESCTPLPVTTPGATVDVDGNGYDGVRITPVSDVTLCVEADVAPHVGRVDREQCGGFGSCMAYYVYFGPTSRGGAAVRLCYTAAGVEECRVSLIPLHADNGENTIVCIGYDLRGGFPCPNGQPVWTEP